MSKPNCGAIVAPCHYPMCLSLDGRCSWPPTMSAPGLAGLNRVIEAQRDAARVEVAALRAERDQAREDAEAFERAKDIIIDTADQLRRAIWIRREPSAMRTRLDRAAPQEPPASGEQP